MKRYSTYHHEECLWAERRITGGQADWYIEWFRVDGTKMRSGYFRNGKQVGQWTTYDRKGRAVKSTILK
jgi:hypothetical protein